MDLKAKVIVDNIPDGEMAGEWGLSIFIEYKGHKCLLDTGASGLFAKNAARYGIDLNEVEFAVLSHAHYDHAGGMKEFFEKNQSAVFYLQKACACYSKKLFLKSYIGIPRKITQQYPERIKLVQGDLKLCDGVNLVAHHTKGLEKIGQREMMFQKTKEGFKPDDFSHEQSLVFDTEKGLVIFNSCSHGGAVNIINEVSAAFPDKKVYGLIGGLHLYNKSEDEVRAVARRIKETGIEYVCTGHCTAKRAYGILKEELGDVVQQLHVGLEIEI